MGDAFLGVYESVEVIEPNYRQVLDDRKVQWVIDYSGDPLDVVLEQSGDWVPTYRDSQTVVLVRHTEATADYLARHPRV